MGFEGDVRESGLKPSSAACRRAVGQAPKPFPAPLAADACTAALAAEAGPGVATISNPPRQPAGLLARLHPKSPKLVILLTIKFT